MTGTQHLKSPPTSGPADGLECLALRSKGESIEAINTHKDHVRGVAGQIKADNDDKIRE